MRRTENNQPCSTASSFVVKKPEPSHFASQLCKGLAGSARESGCGEGEVEVWGRSEVLRTVPEARSMDTTSPRGWTGSESSDAMQEWGSRKKWRIRCRDRRGKEVDRKNKHRRRPEDYRELGGLGEDKQFSEEMYGAWDT